MLIIDDEGLAVAVPAAFSGERARGGPAAPWTISEELGLYFAVRDRCTDD